MDKIAIAFISFAVVAIPNNSCCLRTFRTALVYSPGAGADSPPGDKILMSTEMFDHFTHLLQVSMKSV